MQTTYLHYLVCPECKQDLELENNAEQEGASIMTGVLKCKGCNEKYLIKDYIPCFVSTDSHASGSDHE